MSSARRGGGKPRVLFMAEAVTLAHVARPHVLAQSLAAEQYEVLLASDPRYKALFPDAKYRQRKLGTIAGDQFRTALAQGKPIYERGTLEQYVAEDLQVFEEFAPDVVVGDFRLSLSVSARLRGVPYLAISNAYWSPFAEVAFRCPLPGMTRWCGNAVADRLFRLARPLAFAVHARPMNQLRRAHGLPSLGHDVRRVYTDADRLLYADIPEMYQGMSFPGEHHFVGPILWSPAIERPPWWDQLDSRLSTVYVTLGSSGDCDLLPQIVASLAAMPLNVIVATAGGKLSAAQPKNVFVAAFLPGTEAAKAARIVVCNGGSPTTHQALAAGVPVIGIPANLDQLLNMSIVERSGVGRLLRPGKGICDRLTAGLSQLLIDPATAAAAERMARAFQSHSAVANFQKVLETVL